MKIPFRFCVPSALFVTCLCTAPLWPSIQAASLTWDPAFTGTSTGPSGGNGTWTTNAGTKNWATVPSGTDIAWTTGNAAVFSGVSGTVDVAASVQPSTLTINTGGYLLRNSVSGQRVITAGDITLDTTSSTDHSMVTIGDATNILVVDMSAVTRTYSVASGDTLNFANMIRGTTAGLNKTGAGTLRLSAAAVNGTAGTSSYSGLNTISSGTLQYGINGALNSSGSVSVAGGALDLQTFTGTVAAVQLASGSIVGTGTLTSTTTFDLQAGAVSAVLGGSVGITKSGTGTVSLSASNTYTGVNTLNGGILNVTKDLALGAAPGAATTNIIMDGGTLQYGAVFNLNVNRSIVLNAGGGTIDTNGFNITTALAQAISGTGSLTKAGAGTLILGSGKTYTGGTIVTGGVLQFGVSNILPSTGNITVNGGSLDLRTATQTTSGTAILVSGTIDASTGVAGTLKANAFDVRSGVVTARLQDNAAGATLVKSTSGTVTLTNANTYTGATTVSAGTLIIGVSGSGSVSSAITVMAGTVGGSGTASGSVTIGDGAGGHDAFISPGNSPGTLATGNLSMLSDATYAFELNSSLVTADQIAVTGTVSIDSAAVFSFTDLGAGTLTLGTSFVVIANDSTDAISGAFANLAQGSTFTSGANTYQASYLGGTGNDLTLTVVAVPEPGTCALLGMGALLVLWRSRRKA